VVIDFEPCQPLKTAKKELHVDNGLIIVVHQDDCIVSILEMSNPPSSRSATNPPICPLILALFKIWSKASAARLKSMGERGSPCLKPL